jgi:hypothetical protein
MDHLKKSWTKELIHEQILYGMKFFLKEHFLKDMNIFFEIMNKF